MKASSKLVNPSKITRNKFNCVAEATVERALHFFAFLLLSILPPHFEYYARKLDGLLCLKVSVKLKKLITFLAPKLERLTKEGDIGQVITEFN